MLDRQEIDEAVKAFYLRSMQRMAKPREWSTEVKLTVLQQAENSTIVSGNQDPGFYITKNSNTNAQAAQ